MLLQILLENNDDNNHARHNKKDDYKLICQTTEVMYKLSIIKY